MSWSSGAGWVAMGGLVALGACGSSGAMVSTTATSSSSGAQGGQAGTGGAGGATASSSTTSSTTATSTTTSSTGATSGTGGSGGGGRGTGGSGACSASQKACNGACVAADDPAFGCGAATCDACTNAHGTTACTGGLCAPGCDPGFGDCDGDPTNGCETDTTSIPASCGACGDACVVAHGTAGCATSTCTVASCDAGYADCNGDASDGCETWTDTDTANCGACNRACSSSGVAAKICAAGLCASTCVLGKGNCAQPAAPAADDGCEKDTSSNSLDCGGCGNACQSAMFNMEPTCFSEVCTPGSFLACEWGGHTSPTIDSSSGRCQCNGVGCRPGEACKDPTATDGPSGDVCTCYGGAACAAGQSCCQTPAGCFDLATDAANCGACGRACAPGFACEGGLCSCNAADAACDGGAASGSFTCPAIAGTDVCHCGSTVCSAGQRCLPGGVCG